MAIDLVTLNSEVVIRSIVLLPKNIADDINATSNPQRLFSSINENYTGTCASFYVNDGTITQSNMKVHNTGGDGAAIIENDHIAIAPYITADNATNLGYRVRLNIDDSYIYTPGTNGVQIETIGN